MLKHSTIEIYITLVLIIAIIILFEIGFQSMGDIIAFLDINIVIPSYLRASSFSFPENINTFGVYIYKFVFYGMQGARPSSLLTSNFVFSFSSRNPVRCDPSVVSLIAVSSILSSCLRENSWETTVICKNES